MKKNVLPIGLLPQTQDASIPDGLWKAASGGLFGFLGQVSGRIFALLTSIILARGLDTTQYGIWALVQVLIDFGKTLSMCGLPSGLLRYLPHYQGKSDAAGSKKSMQAVFAFGLGSSVLLSLVLVAVIPAIAPQLSTEPAFRLSWQIFAIGLPFSVVVTLMAFTSLALQNVRDYVILQYLLLPGAALAGAATAVLAHFDLIGVAWATVVAAASSAFIAYLWQKPPLDVRSMQRSLGELRTMLPFSLTILLVSLTSLALTQTDRLILTMFVPLSALGIYHAAAKMAMQLTLILQGFSLALSPTISFLYSQNHFSQLSALYKVISRWILTLSLPVAVLMVLYSREIMSLYGAEFMEGSLVFSLLAVGYLVMNGVGPTGSMLQMTGRQKLSLFNGLLTVALSVALNLWLVRRFGAAGVALGTGLALAFINVLEMVEIAWLLHMHPFSWPYAKTLLAGIVASGIGVFTMTALPAHGALFLLPGALLLLSFVLGLWILGFDDADRSLLEEMKRGRLRSE